MRYTVQVVVIVAVTLLAPGWATCEEARVEASSADPLVPFEPLIGGRWHLEGSYLELSWGLGRRSVRGRNYFVVDGEAKLVGEGLWFWHPGEGRIRGVFTAIDMPVALFDYTTRFEQDRMVSDLRTYDAAGNESVYVETWDLGAEGKLGWKLLQETPEGLRQVMGGTYERQP